MATVPSVALCFHGRMPTWRGRNLPLSQDHNASRRSLARFTADSLQRRVIRSNGRAGLNVEVYMHTWNPELAELLDELYRPARAQHDAEIRGLQAMLSQHESLRRVMALVPEHIELVMMTRLDLILFSDLPLLPLVQIGRAMPALWLPQMCQHNHDVPLSEQQHMYSECGCGLYSDRRKGACYGINGQGGLMEAPMISRWGINPKHSAIGEQHVNFNIFVLDWWFVATPTVARSFAAIGENKTSYVQGVLRRVGVPAWAHFYWAHHVTHVLPESTFVGYAMLAGRDFQLARCEEGPVRACTCACHMPCACAHTMCMRIYHVHAHTPCACAHSMCMLPSSWRGGRVLRILAWHCACAARAYGTRTCTCTIKCRACRACTRVASA